MTRENVAKIAIFLILLSCLIGAANATEDISTDTVNTIQDQTTPQETTPEETQKETISTKPTQTVSDDTVKETTKKETKDVEKTSSESTTTDFYVSDIDGSDANNGTKESPFKTIQTALDKTSGEKINNIHISEGIYKGVGNTNLTVNGNHNINIIGAGINKTIIDGEAKYDIDTIQYHWDSSPFWSFYINGQGNWIMKITQGTGNVKISDFTIQNSWATGVYGGDSIDKYLVATVDNYAQLEVENMYFLNNHGGVGSAIRNNNYATLLVNNSLFIGNRKSQSTGNMGIIYNNGTATISNSVFDRNYARWGTILNDKEIIVINTTLSNNMGYDGQSAYHYGTGFAFNSGEADFYKPGFFLTNNKIINCTFINNTKADIDGVSGNLIATGNKFINSPGIKITDKNQTEDFSFIIENNIFEGIKSRVTHTILEEYSINISISSGARFHEVIIKNNKINSPSGEAIRINTGKITDNIIMVENGMGITIYGNNSIIENNNIETGTDYVINITKNAANNIIKNNYLISKTRFADSSVLLNGFENTVENNLPVIDGICVSPDATVASAGTLENPTTLADALKKVQNNGNIILLPGIYQAEQQIVISDTTTTTGVNKFNIIALSPATIDANNIQSLIKIEKNYDITLSRISIINAPNIAIYNNGNLTITGRATYKNNNATNEGGVIYNNQGNVTINGKNTFSNNKAPNGGSIYNYNGYLSINGENIFDNNVASGTTNSVGGAIASINDNKGYITINGTNTFKNNKATQNGAAIYINGQTGTTINIIGNNQISHNTVSSGTQDAGVIWITGTGCNINIIGNTISDNYAKKTALIFINNYQDVTFENNIVKNNEVESSGSLVYFNGNGNSVNIKNNIFTQNSYTNNLIHIAKQISKVDITKNTFKNNFGTETIYLMNTNSNINKNTYENTPISLKTFKLNSIMDGQKIIQKTEIPLNINIELTNPHCYDSDLLNKNVYHIYVNNKDKYEITTKTTTIKEKYTPQTNGKLGIYVKSSISNQKTNNITVTIQKPLDTSLELTGASETIVKQTIPITIKLLDENKNLIKNAKITISSSNGNETVTLTSGTYIYQYTPTKVGEETIKVTYAGNNTLNPTTNTTTITVKPIKSNSTINLDSTKPRKIIVNLTSEGKAIPNADFTYTLNGGTKQNAKTSADGTFTIITDLTGDVTVVVNYAGNDSYNANTAKKTFNFPAKPSNLVTQNNIGDFFDTNGVLKENAPNELIFCDEFKDLILTINKTVTITGDDALFNNSALNIVADNVKVSNIEFIADENFDKTALIHTNAQNTIIENTTMTITGNNTETVGILAENATITINNNTITTTNNNTIKLNNTNGTINNNTLTAGNNLNGSTSISHTKSNVTVDNKQLTEPEKQEPEKEPEKQEPEKQDPTETKQPTTTPQTPQTPQTIQPTTPKESENDIPAKQIQITTLKMAKTVSKKAKKLTISVKLKVKGKLAKSKQVIIIIKSKRYKATTSKKGIAKLTLKKKQLATILKKVKAGKKVKVQIRYGKKTITKYLKVKK